MFGVVFPLSSGKQSLESNVNEANARNILMPNGKLGNKLFSQSPTLKPFAYDSSADKLYCYHHFSNCLVQKRVGLRIGKFLKLYAFKDVKIHIALQNDMISRAVFFLEEEERRKGKEARMQLLTDSSHLSLLL